MIKNILLFLFLFVSISFAQGINYFSIESHKKFGNYLFESGDFIRANQEYREFLSKQENDTIRIRYAETLFRIERFTEAADYFKSAFYNSSFEDEARLGYFKSLFFAGLYDDFKKDLEINEYISPLYKNNIMKLNTMTYYLEKNPLPDSTEILSYFEDESRIKMSEFYLRKDIPLRKNRTKAALFSALIPGSGKVYLGEYGDGITAFIATGLLTYLAVDNFNANHKLRGAVFSGLAFLSYVGNIYGTALAAEKFNIGIKVNLDKEIRFYFKENNYFLPEIKY
ncbi:MAG: hypothetical protein WC055_08210 [Melioribacteraceae bacterium]